MDWARVALLLLAVVIVCAAVLWHQHAAYAQSRWRLEFEAAQKPNLQLAEVAKHLGDRLAVLERAQRDGTLRALSR